MRVLTIALVCALMSLVATEASARRSVHAFSAKRALESGLAKQKLHDIPVYMKGQKAPRVTKRIGNWSSRRNTSAVFRSDEQACEIAFLSAIIALQTRAESEGGDAVVNIQSNAEGQGVADGEYQCIAGATNARVSLSGDVVKTK